MKYEDVLKHRLNRLEGLIIKMADTLSFYADEKNWEDTNDVYTGEDVVTYSNISVDGGELAQKMLNILKINDD